MADDCTPLYNSIRDKLAEISDKLSLGAYKGQVRQAITECMREGSFLREDFKVQYETMRQVLVNFLFEKSNKYKKNFIAIKAVMNSMELSDDFVMSQNGWDKLMTGLTEDLSEFLMLHDGYQLVAAIADIDSDTQLLSYENIFDEPFYFSRRFVNRVLEFEPVITICPHGILSLSSSDSISCHADNRHMKKEYWSSLDASAEMPLKANIFKLKWWEIKAISMVLVMYLFSYVPLLLRLAFMVTPVIFHLKPVDDLLKKTPHTNSYAMAFLAISSLIEESIVFVFYYVAFVAFDLKERLEKRKSFDRPITNWFKNLLSEVLSTSSTTFNNGIKPISAHLYKTYCYIRYNINKSDSVSESRGNYFTLSDIRSSPMKGLGCRV